MWGAHDPCNREESEISLLQVFYADQSDLAQDLPERQCSHGEAGNLKGSPFSGHRQAKKGLLRQEMERFLPSLFVIFILTIVAVSLGFGVSLYCTNHPSGLRSLVTLFVNQPQDRSRYGSKDADSAI